MSQATGDNGSTLPPLGRSPPTSPSQVSNGGKSGPLSGITNFLTSIGGKNKPSKSSHIMIAKGRPGSTEEFLPPITPGQGLVNQPKTSTVKSPELSLEGFKPKTHKEFRADLDKAKSSGDYKKILKFFETTFSSFAHLNITFKSYKEKPAEDCGLSMDYLHSVFKYILDLPQDIQKLTLKGIINSLLKDMKKPRDKADLRAYLILLQNPQFNTPSTYVIFAHLLRQIANLSDQEHHCLVQWYKRLPKESFKLILGRLENFLSIRLFPPEPSELPPLAKCSWWIPSVAKVLALFNAANNSTNLTRIPYTSFYNTTLDHIDLMKEYHAWQNPVNKDGFTFCQYPFLLSLQGKRTILQKDSEQQMIMTARRSLVATVQQRQMP
ncbi:hypothetical protein BSL78_11758, partial [Apostichopus japonicus]